jgi:hypothetical protein
MNVRAETIAAGINDMRCISATRNGRTLERRGDSLKASQDIGSDFVVGLQISRVTYKFVEVANLAPRMLFHTGD